MQQNELAHDSLCKIVCVWASTHKQSLTFIETIAYRTNHACSETKACQDNDYE